MGMHDVSHSVRKVCRGERGLQPAVELEYQRGGGHGGEDRPGLGIAAGARGQSFPGGFSQGNKGTASCEWTLIIVVSPCAPLAPVVRLP